MHFPGIRINVEMLIFLFIFFGFDTTLKRVVTHSEEIFNFTVKKAFITEASQTKLTQMSRLQRI